MRVNRSGCMEMKSCAHRCQCWPGRDFVYALGQCFSNFFVSRTKKELKIFMAHLKRFINFCGEDLIYFYIYISFYI